MKKVFLLLVLSFNLFSEGTLKLNLWERIGEDHKNYYLDSNYSEAGLVFLLGGLMANTDIDQSLRDFYQDDVRSDSTDEIARSFKQFGEGSLMVPIALGAGIVGNLIDYEPLGDWGEYVSRSYLVGFPTLLLMQKVTGGSRPNELEKKGSSKDSSTWEFWNDENGVSGHSFMGTVPFLVAANLTDNDYLKYFFYGASTFAGISRINDDAHFTSQVILGWYMGYMSVKSVMKTEEELKEKNYAILPIVTDESLGVYFSFNL